MKKLYATGPDDGKDSVEMMEGLLKYMIPVFDSVGELRANLNDRPGPRQTIRITIEQIDEEEEFAKEAF